MQRRTFKTAIGLALTLAALSVPQLATAQAWPTKQPIKMVAVFPPGGSTDQVPRIDAILQRREGRSLARLPGPLIRLQ
jgi:tripartite-type tricarboxylate transporter receptor subunit TctC